MKIKLAALLIICALSSKAQTDTDSNFKYVLRATSSDIVPGELRFNSDASVGSNAINSSMALGSLLFSEISDKAKSTFLNTSVENSNAQLLGNIGLEFGLKGKNINAVSLEQNTDFYMSTSTPIMQLALFGNKRFADQTVSSTNASAWLSTSYTASLRSNFSLGEKSKLSFKYGLRIQQNLVSASMSDFSIFTEEDGEYLDLGFTDLDLITSGANIKGIGAQLGIDYTHTNNRSSFFISANDIGWVKLNKANRFTFDSSFRFEGLNFNINSGDSTGILAMIESEYTSIYNANSTDAVGIVLPTIIAAGYYFDLDDKSGLGFNAVARNFGKFGFTLEMLYDYTIKTNISLRSELGYGNFTGIYLNEIAEFKFMKSNLLLGILGVPSLISGNNFGYAGLSFGFSREF